MAQFTSFNQPPSERQYPFDETGYPQYLNCNDLPKNSRDRPMNSYAEAVELAQNSCTTCQTAQPDLGPIGCDITTSGDPYLPERTNLRLQRPFPDESFISQGQGPIYVPTAGSSFVNGKVSNFHAPYTPEAFQTKTDNADSKISMGVMTNAYTGESFEVFVNDMPPPTTNQALDPTVFEHTNPKLIWANGGIDPNAPLRSKTEICQDIPGPDGGPNVWGDQLYAGERRQRLQEYANRDIWNNRDGDYSTELSLNGERPAGYVGLQRMYRSIPYLPPTQILDNQGYTGTPEVTLTNNMNRELVTGQVMTRRYDLSDCPRTGLPDAPNGNDSTQVIPVVNNRPTWRGEYPTPYEGTAAFPDNQYVVIDTHVRDTLKGQMEVPFPVTQAAAQRGQEGGHVVIDTHVRDTLKEQMEQQYPVTQAALEYTGEGIPFQGELHGTRRQYYSQEGHHPSVGGDIVGQGEFIGSGEIFSSQHRGTFATNYVVPSHVPQEGDGDVSSRWIGYSDRDTQREFAPRTTAAEFNQANSTNIVTPRWRPLVSSSCARPDDIDDDFLHVRPDYFRET